MSVKKANESCHFSSHFRHESVSRWGRQNADSTGNRLLNQMITISSTGVVVCVTIDNGQVSDRFYEANLQMSSLICIDVMVDPDRMFSVSVSQLTGCF